MRRSVGLLCVFLAVMAASPPAAAGPLRTGILDSALFSSPGRQATAFDRTRQTGASVVRLVLHWDTVAPATRPPDFDPANPAHPAYRWTEFDRQVQLATSRGLEPIVAILFAPDWAKAGTASTGADIRPNPAEYGKFAEAAARRYSGSSGLPRIRYWQAWNEPNRDYFLMPQFAGGRMVSAGWYRRMVTQFAAGVRRAASANRVVAGGLAPLGRRGKPAPLAFMRAMLCVTRSGGRACDLRGAPVPFDVWAHHPYTSGGPTHRAGGRDDVSLGNLPKMRRLLRAAVRLGHVDSRSGPAFWATEFSWDTRPPDPQGLAMPLHARWVSEALYRMWRNGVSVVIWFRIQDDPLRSSYQQSGFFTARGSPKRSLTAFRFPVVALRRAGGTYVWGRTPFGAPGRVIVEIKTGGSWRRLGTVRAGGSGIFTKTFRPRPRRGFVRARFNGERSLPFSLTYAPDRFVNPFGCGGPVRC
ncbi:MAG TPA: hypothetical protein VHF67_08585 [Gaiellaceae bacterium]|nr:hypothetical protein [Gaiellaceae bacterium]